MRVVYGLFISLAVSNCASAQQAKLFDPMAVPGGELHCRSLVLPASAPPGSVGLQFEDGVLKVNDRLVSAVYDSSGAPRLLVITATDTTGGKPIMRVFSVSFPTEGAPTGFQIIQPQSGDATDRSGPQPLQNAMLTNADTLARWFWQHRCRSSNTP